MLSDVGILKAIKSISNFTKTIFKSYNTAIPRRERNTKLLYNSLYGIKKILKPPSHLRI